MNKAIFSVNSTVAEGGQGSVVNQAMIEFQKHAALEKVYCQALGKHALGSIPSEEIPVSAKLPRVLLRLPYLRNRRDIVTLASDVIFDKAVSSKIDISGDGLFIGTAGHSLNTIRRLKKHSSKKIILYCMNTHINNLYNIMEEEDRRFAGSMKTHFVHKDMIGRILEECSLSDNIFVLSKYAFDTFIANGIEKEKLRIVKPGIDLSRFFPSEIKSDDIFRVCFVGSLTLRKGFHYLLQAIDGLDIRNLELLLYGSSGDPVSNRILKYYKRRIKIEQRGGDPAEGYRRSDVFVFPSLEDGWGLAVSEAMACGLPVIVTENCGAKDMVEDGRGGFIIPPRNISAIKEKLKLIFYDRKLRNNMSEAVLEKRQIIDQNIASGFFYQGCTEIMNK